MKFIQGNCLDKITELEDNSIDCVVTSPPYWGLRDYGVKEQLGLEPTYQKHIKNIVNIFQLLKPKLKDTATIWLNYGDCYATAKNGRDASNVVGDDRTFRNKPFTTIQGLLKNKDLVMMPNRIAIALQDDGWYIRSEIIWHKPNPMPESIKDRPTSCHEKIWLITKNKKYYYDADAIKEPTSEATKKRMESGINEDQYRGYANGKQNQFNKYFGTDKAKANALKGRNKRNVWTVTTKPFKEAHFATFPPDLIEPCIKAGCPENGTVLDPFAGAGTVGLVCKKLNREAILIELNPDYIEIAKNRINENYNSVQTKETASLFT